MSTWFANARRRLKKENKMTWVPKNRPENDDDENSDKDADEKGNFSSKSTYFTSKITSNSLKNDQLFILICRWIYLWFLKYYKYDLCRSEKIKICVRTLNVPTWGVLEATRASLNPKNYSYQWLIQNSMVSEYRYLTNRSFFIWKISNFWSKIVNFGQKAWFPKYPLFQKIHIFIVYPNFELKYWMGRNFEQRTKSECVVLILTSARSRIQPSAPDAPSPEIWPKRNAVSYRTFHFLTIIQLDNLLTKKFSTKNFSLMEQNILKHVWFTSKFHFWSKMSNSKIPILP